MGYSGLSSITGVDRVTDFTPGVDKLNLRSSSLDLFSPSGQRRLDVVNSDSAAELSASSIVYNQTNGKLFYNTNGIAPGFNTVSTSSGLGGVGSYKFTTAGGLFATLDGAPSLTEADLIRGYSGGFINPTQIIN